MFPYVIYLKYLFPKFGQECLNKHKLRFYGNFASSAGTAEKYKFYNLVTSFFFLPISAFFNAQDRWTQN